MMIEMDVDARKWIEAKGSQLTVKTMNVNVCCAPGVQEVVAVPGKPKTLNHYDEVKIDTFSIYLHKSIGKKEKLILKLSGFPLLKSISAQIQ
jgi:hypothetical protein